MEMELLITADKRQHVENRMEAQQQLMESGREPGEGRQQSIMETERTSSRRRPAEAGRRRRKPPALIEHGESTCVKVRLRRSETHEHPNVVEMKKRAAAQRRRREDSEDKLKG